MKKIYIPARAHSTPDYNHEWYRANATYKRLCSRIYRRQKRLSERQTLDPESDYQSDDYRTALRIIQDDRRELVAKGKWVDERNGREYLGITPRAWCQLEFDLTF